MCLASNVYDKDARVLPEDVDGVEGNWKCFRGGDGELGAEPDFTSEAATACATLAFGTCRDVVTKRGIRNTGGGAVTLLDEDDVPFRSKELSFKDFASLHAS